MNLEVFQHYTIAKIEETTTSVRVVISGLVTPLDLPRVLNAGWQQVDANTFVFTKPLEIESELDQ